LFIRQLTSDHASAWMFVSVLFIHVVLPVNAISVFPDDRVVEQHVVSNWLDYGYGDSPMKLAMN